MHLFENTYKTLGALLMPLLLTASGCINDDSPCPQPSGEDKEPTMVMQFSIVTRGSVRSTRAVVMPEKTEIGFPAEDYLDIPNLKFYLFDNNGNLLENFYPTVYAEPGSDYVKYTATAMMTNKYFTEAISNNLTFSIMVLANTSNNTPGNLDYGSIGGVYQTNLDFKDINIPNGSTLADCFTKSPAASFAMPKSVGWAGYWKPNFTGEDYTDDKGGIAGYNGERAYIPMSGLQTFTVSVAALKASSAAQPVQLSDAADGAKDINMLRAFAKIEVVDKINAFQDADGIWHQPDRAQRTYIDKAELMGYVTRGSLLPSNLSQWNLNGIAETQYCSAPSIPTNAGATFVEAVPVSDTQLTTENYSPVSFFADTEATAKRTDGCRVFSCYLTEYSPAIAAGKTPMWIRCTLTNPMDENGNPLGELGKDTKAGEVVESPLYRIWVRPYDANGNVSETEYTNIIRNNIYRFEVTSINQTIGIKWTVCNMDDATVNIPTFN